MCWHGINKVRIAKFDIHVYKRVNFNNISEFYHFQYYDGLQQLVTIYPINDDINPIYCSIHQGYHSYSYISKKFYCLSLRYKIVPCIIPKGTKFYLNNAREIVSENIIYNKELSFYPNLISKLYKKFL